MLSFLKPGRVFALIPILVTLVSWQVTAQQVLADGCLRLIGSAACPAYSYAYVHPANLSNAFPWMAGVTDVSSFDAAVFTYLSNPNQWATTKFQNQLGCTNATNAYIRWTRTVLCSKWVNEQWSINCDTYYNGSTAATSMKMVCQDTCLQYSSSENAIVNNSIANFCPGPDLTGNLTATTGNRTYWLNKDFVDCTNWTTLATNNASTCIAGSDNEGQCGFGTSSIELCNFCKGSNPDPCCYNSNTDTSVCGYALPARVSSSASSSASATSSSSSVSSSAAAANDNNAASYSRLSGGQIAGIVVGSVIGGLLLLALLILLLWFCCIKKRRDAKSSGGYRDSGSSFGPAAAGGAAGAASGGIFNAKSSNRDSNNPNSSEKGLLGGQQSRGNVSSPTMGGDTMYSGMAGNASGGSGSFNSPASGATAGGVGLGLGAAAAGAFGENQAGMRTSGVVLPRVKDENQNGDRWIETGSEVTVLWPYQATLPDELDLRPGMKLRVLRLYDDAWGTAQVISGGEASEAGKQGAFPIVCVSEGSSLGTSPASSAGSH